MQHKMLEVKATITDQGVFSALLATWTVDRMNERIVKGAFNDTIARWQESGKMIPLHWDHSARPEDIIGVIDPKSMKETDDGLYVEGRLDLDDSDVAREAWRSMKNDSVALSFGYLVLDDREGEDGITELVTLDLFEGTITPAPANADTRITSMKALDERWQRGEPVSLADFKATDASWDGAASRFTDEQYARSCILDRAKCGSSDMPAKQRYSLPVREPGGELNSNAVHAAAARIGQVEACPEAISSAKAALRRAYGELDEEPPDSIKSLTVEDADEEPSGQVRAQDPLKDEIDLLRLEAATGKRYRRA